MSQQTQTKQPKGRIPDPHRAPDSGEDADVAAFAHGGVTTVAIGNAVGESMNTAVDHALGADVDRHGSAHREPDPINPTEEDAYWRDNYIHRPYADDTLSYDHYRPAYRYGWESRARFADRRWDEVEKDLGKEWRVNRGESRLGWTDARLAAKDAWQRVEMRLADQRALNGR